MVMCIKRITTKKYNDNEPENNEDIDDNKVRKIVLEVMMILIYMKWIT